MGHRITEPTSDMQVIVLTAGQARRLWPLAQGLPKALVSIGGKPAIFHMLLPLIQRGVRDITFVVSPGSKQIIEMVVGRCLGGLGITLRCIEQIEPLGPGDALTLCREIIRHPTMLLLADTLCPIPYQSDTDWIGVAPIEPSTFSRWCLVECNNKSEILKLIDKPSTQPDTNLAVVGIYFLRDPEALRNAIGEAQMFRGRVVNDEFQLSSILTPYMKNRRLHAIPIESWIDIGTLDGYIDAVPRFLKHRNFNQIDLSPTGQLSKRSNLSSIKQEIEWYRCLADGSASWIAPRLLNEDKDSLGYSTEYFDYSSLAELFVYGCLPDDNLAVIFQRVVQHINTVLWDHKHNLEDMKSRAENMYVKKTLDRLQGWSRQDLIRGESYRINGQQLPGFDELWHGVQPLINRLIDNSPNYASYIHGDPSFGNILISPRVFVTRLVDPRGDFGGPGPFGDSRYDAAKLRQCYHGKYDFILDDLFTIKEPKLGEFEIRHFAVDVPNPKLFDDQLSRLGFDPIELQLIEGLLFLSMIPLHNDSSQRQVMFFVAGIECLADILSKSDSLAYQEGLLQSIGIRGELY